MPNTLYCGSVGSTPFRGIFDKRFKTLRTTAYFFLPMEKGKTAARALVPCILCRATRKIPDYTQMGRYLSGLYGASLQADCGKMGDMQLLSVTVSGLADRYALEKEAISESLLQLLVDVILDPPLDEQGNFFEESFLQERRQMIEQLQAEYSDKRVYALRRLNQIMCGDEPYGLPRLGTREELESLTAREVTQAWRDLLKNAHMEIFSVGDGDPAQIERALLPLSREQNGTVLMGSTVLRAPRGPVRRVEETDQVAQAKMVMGFRTGTVPQEENEAYAAKVMCALLGGSPQSKLFCHVREEMSLCYYCSSRFQNLKGILTIESGVQPDNIGRAQEAILQQVQAIQNGEFTKEELDCAKLSMQNSYRTVEDYAGSLESWYMSQVQYPFCHTPEEANRACWAVTAEQVIEAARSLRLDTVYCLIGGDAHEEN